MNPVKKIVGYVLICLILVFTFIAILGIWGVIDLEEIMMRVLYSLLVVFAASAVILFIFTVIVKEDPNKE